jgi:DNA-binding MltR family transcriptional regulator
MATGMFNTSNAVKTLRRYWKNRASLPDPATLSRALNHESDRAAVILASAILDDVLTMVLAQRFAIKIDETQSDYVFRYEGPLGSFSSRVEIAYLFGIIEEATRSQLSDIREMRNACAHSKQTLTFAHKELANVAKRLFKPRGVTPLAEDTRDAIRHAFMIEFVFINFILIYGSRKRGIAEAAASWPVQVGAPPPWLPTQTER